VRAERGAAAVEFALVAPLLVLLVFGIVSYGYLLSFRQAMSQAAAEGARAAAVTPDRTQAPGNAVLAVNDALGSYGVSCTADGRLLHGTADAGTCRVSAPQTCSSGSTLAQCVRVELAYTYRDEPLVPALAIGFALPEELSYTTEVQVS
jgi:Flp pilus assembly protein TadG